MKSALIIDTSYLIYRSYFAFPKLTYNGQPTGAFYGFARAVLQLLDEKNPEYIIFALDTPEPTWRHHKRSDYKAGRTPPDPEMIFQIPEIITWCHTITENVFGVPGYEADDIIYTLSRELLLNEPMKMVAAQEQGLFEVTGEFSPAQASAQSESMKPQYIAEILSADRDLYQLYTLEGVEFLQGKQKGEFGRLTKQDFRDKYELEPIQWLDYKALVGDNSDNLPGIPGVGPKTATKILHEAGSLYALYSELGFEADIFLKSSYQPLTARPKDFVESEKNAKLIDKIKAHYEQIKEIYELSALLGVPNVQLQAPGFDIAQGKSQLLEKGFSSIVKMVNDIESRKLQPDELF